MLVRSSNGTFFQPRVLNIIDVIFGKFKQRLLIEYFVCMYTTYFLLGKKQIFQTP